MDIQSRLDPNEVVRQGPHFLQGECNGLRASLICRRLNDDSFAFGRVPSPMDALIAFGREVSIGGKNVAQILNDFRIYLCPACDFDYVLC